MIFLHISVLHNCSFSLAKHDHVVVCTPPPFFSDASRERHFYKDQCQAAKVSVAEMMAQDVNPGTTPVNTRPVTIHYSIDYIQNLLLPTCAQQPGKLYFKSGRKANLFIAANEGRPHGTLYIIDEV